MIISRRLHRLWSQESRGFVAYVQAMRPHQWLKNFLIFLPAIAGHQFGVKLWAVLFCTFVSFSSCASASYLFNDMRDIRHDRGHANKKHRPLASGRIPIRGAMVLALILLALSFSLATTISVQVAGVLFVYLAVTLGYTFFLKRKVALDVVTLACLYTLRVLAGSLASGIVVSSWFMGFCLFLFFSLALIKRAAELVAYPNENATSLAGRGYFRNDLPVIEMLAAASGYISVLVLALYIESPAVLKLYRHPAYLWAACVLLLYWFSRILIITHRGAMHEDPVIFTVKDKVSLITMALVFLVMLAGV